MKNGKPLPSVNLSIKPNKAYEAFDTNNKAKSPKVKKTPQNTSKKSQSGSSPTPDLTRSLAISKSPRQRKPKSEKKRSKAKKDKNSEKNPVTIEDNDDDEYFDSVGEITNNKGVKFDPKVYHKFVTEPDFQPVSKCIVVSVTVVKMVALCLFGRHFCILLYGAKQSPLK